MNMARRPLARIRADNADIEIVSPSFMNQRPQPDGLKMIAKSPGHTKQEEASPEDVIFDKAEEAEQKEKSKETLCPIMATYYL